MLTTSAMVIAAWIILGVAAFALLLFGVGIAATWRHTRRTPALTAELPPVSLLKPLKGLEDQLEANLESFFTQDYPHFEVVIATVDADDPALRVARSVAARHPHVPVRFVVSDDAFGLNPKVANLSGALRAVSHDLIHQSDGNVRVGPGYLRRIVGEFVAADASILTSVVVGVGERSVGAALENLQLSAYIAPAMCLALEAANITCVCGKSMLLRKSELEEEFGGLESVRNVLCEDFVLGERYKAAGKTVLLSSTTVQNVNVDCGADRFFARHSRWLKMRITLHLPGFCADLLSNPIGLSAIAVVVSGFDWRVALAAAGVWTVKTLADQLALRFTRAPFPLRYVWLSLVKDLALVPLWVFAIFSRTVVWRGRKLRFGKDTRLVPVADALADAALADAHPIVADRRA
ncbi:MAG: glycosyltransferase [Myxococcota bacterium]